MPLRGASECSGPLFSFTHEEGRPQAEAVQLSEGPTSRAGICAASLLESFSEKDKSGALPGCLVSHSARKPAPGMGPMRTGHAAACLLGTAGHRLWDMHSKRSVCLGLTNIPNSKEHGGIFK